MESFKDIIHRCGKDLGKIVCDMVATRDKEVSQNLPLLPLELKPLSERLDKTEFTLVVSGEVNRGKSTFINAIIGADILPTFDKETTSQVFKIKNSDIESYSVVYGNGDRKCIKRENLVKYGTQLDSLTVNIEGSENSRILFIEVCYPIKNLPAGVTIVDTPGIGSTFKEHTEIAKGFMQEADAIIYLCSAKHPMVKVDIDFITKSILPLPTSPNVLFVMSKADQADSEGALRTLVVRAQDQLAANFKNYDRQKKRTRSDTYLISKKSMKLSFVLLNVKNFVGSLQHSIAPQNIINSLMHILTNKSRSMILTKKTVKLN